MSSQALLDLSRSTKTHRLLSAPNSVNATNVKASAGLIFGITGFNAGTITYLKIYDKASAPSEADTPRRTEYIAANTKFHIPFDKPLEMQAGIGYRLTTAGADNDTGAVGAAAILAMNIDYA